MSNQKPQFRKGLNKKQLHLLKLLYRFRFGTTELIAGVEDTSSNQIYRRLRTLLEQEYVGRNYEPQYKLRGKHASYYLLGKGIKALKQYLPDFGSVNVFHNIHRDKMASERFIDRSLAVFDVYSRLRAQYGDKVTIKTRSDLAESAKELKPIPDAILLYDRQEFFLDICTDKLRATEVVNNIKEYARALDTNNSFSLFIVCEDQNQQSRLQKRISLIKESDLINIYISSRDRLATIGESNKVWYKPESKEEPLALHDLIFES